MRGPDLDRERCEEARTLDGFLAAYHEGLPPEFPRVSRAALVRFAGTHPELFRSGSWSLDQHRKRVMDWLPSYLRETEESR